jgi:hypothetical protein
MDFSVFYRVTLFGGSLLVLAACDPVGTPGWMPNAYRFQDNTPLSSPAPSRPWVDEAVIHDTEKLASNTAAWQGAVFELVEKISPSLPTDGSPLFLQEPVVKTAQNQALDHYLRQALMQKGFHSDHYPRVWTGSASNGGKLDGNRYSETGSKRRQVRESFRGRYA